MTPRQLTFPLDVAATFTAEDFLVAPANAAAPCSRLSRVPRTLNNASSVNRFGGLPRFLFAASNRSGIFASSASGISSPMHAMQKILRNSSCVVSGGAFSETTRLVRTDRNDSSPISSTATGSLLGR